MRSLGAALLTSAVFQNNQCTSNTCVGGAILAGGALALSNTQILSSTAGSFGGGVSSSTGAITVLTATLLQGNACTQGGCQGGALWTGGLLTATTTQFIHNTSTSSGGALYAFDSAFLATNVFRDNQCTQSSCQGGALAGRVNLALTGTQFLSNTAQGDGGGLWAGGALTLTNTSFYTNTTHGNGGGLHASSTVVIQRAASRTTCASPLPAARAARCKPTYPGAHWHSSSSATRPILAALPVAGGRSLLTRTRCSKTTPAW